MNCPYKVHCDAAAVGESVPATPRSIYLEVCRQDPVEPVFHGIGMDHFRQLVRTYDPEATLSEILNTHFGISVKLVSPVQRCSMGVWQPSPFSL